MHSLQSNFCDRQNGEAMHGSMFVWNEFLTRGIRNHLKNTLWTVALVYGFFKQAKLSVSGKDFHLTLIARRSRHYAGTRYLKRGVNDKGKVANDVETEQIVFEDECRCGCPIQMSSVVQNRGSIPLFWSQETSRLNLKPDIILHRKDRSYEATRLHFENLVKRYGNPIIILNLIKTNEKRPRESILRAEFANAIDFINRDSSDETSLKFLHWDLHKHFRKKTTNVLGFLGRVAACALTSTGYFYCQVSPSSTTENTADWPFLENDDGEDSSYVCLNHNVADDVTTSGCGALEDCSSLNKDSSKFPKFQRGVLRTNCIDCLDRTNVAQYTYGLAALGHQLHELGLIDTPQIDLDTPLADTLMSFYETMGDTLALQYGGSAAHNKIFSQRRGQWKVTIQSQEFFRTLQRYYSNAYMDAEKQDAINVFLGYLRPLHGRSSLWDLDSDHHWNLNDAIMVFLMQNYGNRVPASPALFFQSVLERSISDGNIHCESCILESSAAINGEKQLTESVQPARMSEGSAMGLSVSTPEISTCDSDTSYSRCTPSEVCRREFRDGESLSLIGHSVDPSTFSNFLDLEWLSTSESSAEEISTRSSAVDGVPGGAASGGSTTIETTSAVTENGSMLTQGSPERAPQEGDGAQILDKLQEFSDSFAHWVAYGGILSRCV
ncbi:unnamed protein product [Spirodela intermedia]|uniref:SAC domain-containing protein n=1 Tax=Spirodela intermedia TaxID=51605 RepID=A0A7I8J2K0_SPIIN|nr:unnamed protein product [Spirodela intermedia]CAA6664202.1 unnamed protein product [Spirodela intermedia]